MSLRSIERALSDMGPARFHCATLLVEKMAAKLLPCPIATLWLLKNSVVSAYFFNIKYVLLV